jgi:hypothetical protein
MRQHHYLGFERIVGEALCYCYLPRFSEGILAD